MTESAAEFTPAGYKAVAEEHILALETLYSREFYVLALYVAGVAVEAILRAYRVRLDPRFDSRHDLYELLRAAKFADIVPQQHADRFAAAFFVVATRWSNNHRYRSASALRTYLKRAKLDRGIKGDFLKENARRVINAATEVVMLGITLWKKS